MVLLALMDSHASDLRADKDMVSAIVSSRPAKQNMALQPEPSHLSPLEQSVVALSLFDARSTAGAPGLFSRLLSRFFGLESPNRLASRRLEMLRCYSIIAREAGGCPDACDVERMKCSGFSEAKIREVNRLVARRNCAIHMKSWQTGSDQHAA
jgi:hypothetical protein